MTALSMGLPLRRHAGGPCWLLLARACAGSAEAYYWPQRAGNAKLTGHVPHIGPRDFSAGPAWSWPNHDDELMRHGPLLDGAKNLYLVTAHGWVRKFSPDGGLLWAWRNSPEQGKMVTSGFLWQGSIYVSSIGSYGPPGYLFALSMDTGMLQLQSRLPDWLGAHPDSFCLVVHNGTIITAAQSHEPRTMVGNNRVLALSAADGRFLWEFKLDQGAVWNFMPALPGDGTLLFSTQSARAYRLSLDNGQLLWKADFPELGHWTSTGGGALAPDGQTFFAVGSYFQTAPSGLAAPLSHVPPCSWPNGACFLGAGVLVAYRVADGGILWARRFGSGPGKDSAGNQYPAVAPINGEGSRLAVFAAIGWNPDAPKYYEGAYLWMPWLLKEIVHAVYLRSALARRYWFRVPLMPNSVHAIDAETGADIWVWREEFWDRLECAGDERLRPRLERLRLDPARTEVICLPDSWGIPTVGGDGTVYAASGRSGNLYALRDANGDGRIQDHEVSTFETHNGFLNGPALGPGILAAAPCWGPMHVFRS